ncbi:MAG: hypothetical protein IJ661_11125 [Lachnospiraceae bacterium]|nr:hypothetical protein [Lachnospiraceae bacterium]
MKQFIFCVSDEKNFYNGIRDLDEYCSCNKVSSLLFHLYCGINDEEMIMKCVDMLKTKFPDALLTGISSNGEIMDGRLIDKDILVSAIVFESSLVSVHEFNDAADNVYDIGKQIRYLADSTENIVGVDIESLIIYQGGAVSEEDRYRIRRLQGIHR